VVDKLNYQTPGPSIWPPNPTMPKFVPDFDTFTKLAQSAEQGGARQLIPVFCRVMSDQLTPVLAYRRLTRPDDRMAPSFLLESVIDGDRQGRYSYIGAQPIAEVIARGQELTYKDHLDSSQSNTRTVDDPLHEMAKIGSTHRIVSGIAGLPDFTGGWVGCVAYDAVRYLEGEKLPDAPADDRGLPEMHMQLYRELVAFDHVQKTVLVITHVSPEAFDSLEDAYEAGSKRLIELVERIETPYRGSDGPWELPPGEVDLESPPPKLPISNMGDGGYQQAVEKAKEYIMAGDAFQIVPSQRFDLKTKADPFDIYRSLRVVNPSPYMFYVQIEGCILVGSSPEILCRVQDGVVTNRPLAGTRHRGKDTAEDLSLESELLADPKDRAEHIMLVDLGRNDVGRVAQPGTIELPRVMNVERYSHVMHISSTVTGQLAKGATCWDALQMALPVGTVSGAPKVRAMQIIDELEPTRRGPYAGAVGYADFSGNLDMAIALRTMVILPGEDGQWAVHVQAGAGIVADSDPDSEHIETCNKAAALAKAVDIAERAFAN